MSKWLLPIDAGTAEDPRISPYLISACGAVNPFEIDPGLVARLSLRLRNLCPQAHLDAETCDMIVEALLYDLNKDHAVLLALSEPTETSN